MGKLLHAFEWRIWPRVVYSSARKLEVSIYMRQVIFLIFFLPRDKCFWLLSSLLFGQAVVNREYLNVSVELSLLRVSVQHSAFRDLSHLLLVKNYYCGEWQRSGLRLSHIDYSFKQCLSGEEPIWGLNLKGLSQFWCTQLRRTINTLCMCSCWKCLNMFAVWEESMPGVKVTYISFFFPLFFSPNLRFMC